MLIAITGCIGSGKSYILQILAKHFHYQTYSCDDFVKASYFDAAILSKIDEKFHCVIAGKVDKNLLKNQLNEHNIQTLNDIIHPYVINKIKQIKANNKDEIIFIEVPLLFESNLTYLFDYSIMIYVDDTLRHQMLKKRDTSQYENMLKLEQYQFNSAKKASLASFVLNSKYDEIENIKQLEAIISKIKS